jgi:uncharacterized protein YndB with AHSA1/START domain
MSLAATMTLTTPSDREICFTRTFKAPRALVFDAFTRPDLLARWMIGPDGWSMSVCEVDLRPGGRFRYVWTKAGGKEMGMGGTFVEITPPERIVHVELFDEDWTGGETRVTTELVEQDGVTRMSLTVRYASQAARDGALQSGMTSGMEMSYARLDRLLGA